MTTPDAVTDNAPILLVDDDPTSLDVLRRTLDGRGFRLFVTRNGNDALKVARRCRPMVILLDVMMPGMDGYETCRRLKADPETTDAAVVFLSALEETRDKVQGLQVGAVDFITKPFQGDEVIARVNAQLTIQRLRRQLEERNRELSRELAVAQELLSDARRRVEGSLLGNSPAVRALRESVEVEARSLDPLLLVGPHGAGHEATARAIHHASARSRQTFLHVNCALLPPGQDSGLLPPVTAGSAAQRMSLLEMAQGGTLYLEEVQRLPADTQESIAEVLDGIAADRDLSGNPVNDVRLIAYSSAPLSASSGFHPRLLARLERRQLRVPSLAERAADIPELALFFVRQHARRIGSVVEGIADQSMRRLSRYRWPGDVQELRSLLERAVTSARGPLVQVDESLLDEGLPLGSYRLVEKLGQGGMGEVWRARHHLLARPCAVKLIRPELLDHRNREETMERFRREARTIARLSSPNTVQLYDFGVSETGSSYFVMELLQGMDLQALVESFGPLPPERTVAILHQACRALAEAHQAGLLHRDIKPQNLFLCHLGLDVDVVKVLDFGLVKSLSVQATQITSSDVLTGTPAYMPPERAVGQPADERSDLYSLGCVAYFMLTGKPVFVGEPMAVILQHVRTAPQAPSKVAKQPLPKALDRLVLKCLNKAPRSRPASAMELWRLLGEVPLGRPWSGEIAETWWRTYVPEGGYSQTGDSSMGIESPD